MSQILKVKSEGSNIVSKTYPSDIGCDLVCTDVYKRISTKTTMFETGIRVKPPKGFYIEIVPRSSIVKTGYILTNSTGVIDPDYRGTLKVCLTKVDELAPELKPPFRVTQLIMRKIHYYSIEKVENLEETKRGENGFGSTS